MHVSNSFFPFLSIFVLFFGVVEPSVHFVYGSNSIQPLRSFDFLRAQGICLKVYLPDVSYFGSSWLLPRTPLTLLTYLSATVKILWFKLAEKFLLDEFTYLVFMITSEARGILRTPLPSTGANFWSTLWIIVLSVLRIIHVHVYWLACLAYLLAECLFADDAVDKGQLILYTPCP